jgi:hypothetical protein
MHILCVLYSCTVQEPALVSVSLKLLNVLCVWQVVGLHRVVALVDNVLTS